MTLLYRLTALLLFLTFAGSVYAIAPQFENQIIEKVTISINAPTSLSINEESVKAKIRMRNNTFFSQTEFDNDLKLLSRDFYRVEPELESIGGKMFITLKLWPKPTIRDISWNGNHKIPAKELRDELGVAKGSIYDSTNFNDAFRKVKNYYLKQGFFEAQLDYCIAIDPITNEADIVITVQEGRAGMIRTICFNGFTADEEEEIRGQMMTKTYNMFLSWMTEEGSYNEEMMQMDRYMIINALQNRGYADARVEIEVCEAKKKNRINITITADKGERYCFGKVTFSGNNLFDDEKIQNALAACEGRPYSPQRVQDSVANITDLYGKCGYIDAFVDFEASLDPETFCYDIDITIDEGEQWRVGMIKVFGNCSTHTTTILHETLVVPGEVFNSQKLKRTEERLNNVGFFKCVNVYAVRSEGPASIDDGCGNYRDVHIEVEETGTGSFSAFAGLSTMENAFAGLKVTEKNFNICGLSSCWEKGPRMLRGAGEYAHATATIGTKSRSYLLSWTRPYFRDTPWSVGVDLDMTNNRYVSNAYDINAGGVTLFASRVLNPFVRFNSHYRFRATNVDLMKKFKKNPTDKQLEGYNKMKKAAKEGLISATGFAFLYDSTDSIERPTRGTKSRFETELAGIGGNAYFASFAYLNSLYLQAHPNGVVKFRGDLKFIQPFASTHYNSLPLDERLFLGGDTALRGYRAYNVGPVFKTSKDPSGGVSLALASMEYTHRIFDRLDAFAFFDAGSLTKHTWRLGKFYLSYGFGIKFQAFAAGPPVTLGWGFPINPDNDSQVKRFFLSLGSEF